MDCIWCGQELAPLADPETGASIFAQCTNAACPRYGLRLHASREPSGALADG